MKINSLNPSIFTKLILSTLLQRKIPIKIGSATGNKDELEVNKKIIEKYKNHSSASIIRKSIYVEEKFKIQFAIVRRINNTVKNINTRKAAGPSKILAKAIKFAANVTDLHLINIINNDVIRNGFSESAKTAPVRPLFKKVDIS